MMANPTETRRALNALRARPLPERIKAVRELYGWTQDGLLRIWSVMFRHGDAPAPPLRCTISNWERGYCTPYPKNREALAILFGVDSNYFNP